MTNINTIERVASAFETAYGKPPSDFAFTPYRICPLGAHIDHQLGKITGFAIDKGVYIAYDSAADGMIEAASMQFTGAKRWSVHSTPSEKANDWANHLRGATIALSERYPLHIGISAVVCGELPIGGLSSSAAVIIAFLSALSRVNGIKLSSGEMIEISRQAENRYVGVSCGKLDQSCEVYCKKDFLLYMDMSDDGYELIPSPPSMKPYEFAIFFSGLDRSLAGTKYNMRVDEARSACYALKAFSGMEYGRFADTYLRDLPYEIFREYRDMLPQSWAKRAEHYYAEFDRVESGAEAWRLGDLERFGRLCFESGKSSIENWETGSPELVKLYSIMTETDGIYGGRFSGAGIKGCAMAIIDPDFEESILERVERQYTSAFPELKDKYGAYICRSADGVRL